MRQVPAIVEVKKYPKTRFLRHVRTNVFLRSADPKTLAELYEQTLVKHNTRFHPGSPAQESKVWLEKLTEVDQERRGYQRLTTKGQMTDDELNEELAELAETRKIAERELEALRGRGSG